MNYFEYFSEIEERFITRRGTVLLLSTLDWALIETWQEAGVPLPAVLRGIDAAFDKYEARKARAKGRLAKVNGLAWCAQAVMTAATEMAEATLGIAAQPTAARPAADTGFEAARLAAFLARNATMLEKAVGTGTTPSLQAALSGTAARLRQLATEVHAGAHPALDELDRTLTVLEERLHAAAVAALPEADLVALRAAADRELTPFRARMGAIGARQVRESFVHKRLFESLDLPRLSLFYMPLADPGEPDPGQGEVAA